MADSQVAPSEALSRDENPVSVIDRDSTAPQGTPCEACGCPVEPGDKFCPACGCPNPQQASSAADAAAPAPIFIRCQNCGSEMAADLQQRSYVCPFCDSTYVAEFSPEQTGR